MAEMQTQTKTSAAGNVTVSFSKAQRARGVSVVQDANLKISQDEFLAKLEALEGKRTSPGFNCAMGRIVNEIDEPVKSKLKEALINEQIEASMLVPLLAEYGYELSSNIVRRHRRRMMGKDGCKCQRES
jgi:hypothetical protein